jgi:hypothetical protein
MAVPRRVKPRIPARAARTLAETMIKTDLRDIDEPS